MTCDSNLGPTWQVTWYCFDPLEWTSPSLFICHRRTGNTTRRMPGWDTSSILQMVTRCVERRKMRPSGILLGWRRVDAASCVGCGHMSSSHSCRQATLCRTLSYTESKSQATLKNNTKDRTTKCHPPRGED